MIYASFYNALRAYNRESMDYSPCYVQGFFNISFNLCIMFIYTYNQFSMKSFKVKVNPEVLKWSIQTMNIPEDKNIKSVHINKNILNKDSVHYFL